MRISSDQHERNRHRGKRDQPSVAKHDIYLSAKLADGTIGMRRTTCKVFEALLAKGGTYRAPALAAAA
jgi:hypothetical protein